MQAFHTRRAPVLALCICGLAMGAWAQTGNIAVNETGAAADPKAMLDVSSVTKGLLVPRMTQAQRDLIATPQEGLLIYQTNPVTRGFYVMQGGAWTPLVQGRNGWDIYGNLLLNLGTPSPDFIGTTDNRPLLFRTNNTHRMRMEANNGFLGVGFPLASAALERLDINGALGIYYEPPAGQDPSATAAAGVFRYQPFGTVTGTANYRYGNREGLPMPATPISVYSDLFDVNYPSPLQYAAHWGNITGQDTVPGRVYGTVPPTKIQPELGGWRAFENPYNEVFGKTWNHVRTMECLPNTAIIPYGTTVGGVWSSTLPPADLERSTPYNRNIIGPFSFRRQYLYFAEELNLELAQVAGHTATEGLCPGAQVNQIAFYVNGTYVRGLSAPTQGHVIVRNAPVGLDQLNGFDNTPDNSGTMGCGPISPATWPDATGIHWQVVTLTTPFIWDGRSNVLVEVAGSMGGGPPGAPAPAYVHQLPVNVTYAGTASALPGPTTFTLLTNPYPPGPGWACPALFTPVANTGLLLPDVGTLNYSYGASTWRPYVRFGGEVAKQAAVPITGTDRFIHYKGALVLEDPAAAGNLNILSTGLPWGRWRLGFPSGYTAFNYKGNGTISAQQGVYDDRTRLNDHVFDRAFDGRVAPQDALEFGGKRNLSMDEMAAFTQLNRHLPTMKGREDWKREDGFSLGDLTNQLWTTAETQALYLTELHEKLDLLEMLSTDRPLNAKEFQAACRQLAPMPQYTDADKARLMADMRRRTPVIPTPR